MKNYLAQQSPHLLLALVLAAGCAPSIAGFEKHLDAGEYAEAVASAGDDPTMQVELAALVLERAATDGVQTPRSIDALAWGGKPGKRALKRLTERAPEPVSRQAQIALMGGRPPSADVLAAFTDNDSSEVRARALRAWHSELEIPALEKALIDPDPYVRRWAAKGLCRFNGSDGTDGLLRDALRRDPDAKVRAQAARCGKSLGPDVLLVLKAALEDKNMGVRLSALQGLAGAGIDAALPLLEDRARGPLDELAVAAAAELARLGMDIGKERLHDALADDRPQIRKTALLRLERAQIEERNTILTGLLEDEAPGVVLLAAVLLAGREEAAPAVLTALQNIVAQGGERAAEARDQLAVLGDPEAVEETKQALVGGEEAEIITVLGRVHRAHELAQTFVALLGDKRENVRLAAAYAALATIR